MRARGLLAGLVVGAGVIVLAGIFAVAFLGRARGVALDDLGRDFPSIVMFVTMIAVGALIVGHDARHRVGWIFAGSALLLGIGEVAGEYAEIAGRAGDPGWLGLAAAWVSNWAWAPGFGPIATLLLLWFPTGGPPGPRWRWVQTAAVTLIGSLTLILAFAADPESESTIPNPLAIDWLSNLADKLFMVIGPLFPVLVATCAASVIVRFRRSRGDERQQLKWFILAAAVMAAGMAVDTALTATGRVWARPVEIAFQLMAFTGLPVAAGVAILRYRLYDIDVVINRTLVYGALTAILASLYFGLVVVFQGLLGPVTEQSDLAVAASTLAVAAMFGPGRRRVQTFIDRRFYRSRYDAQRTLESFSSRLRDDIDLDHLSSELLAVVTTTMRPRHASLWLRGEPT